MPRITIRIPEGLDRSIENYPIYNKLSLIRAVVNWYIGKEKYGTPEELGVDKETSKYMKNLVDFGYFRDIKYLTLYIVRVLAYTRELKEILDKKI